MEVVAEGLTKRYGSTLAVDGVGFSVAPVRVTAFLGPNGAGKSTVMRLMLGLDRGQGRTLFGGRSFAEHPHPARVAGAHLDAKAFHRGLLQVGLTSVTRDEIPREGCR